MSIFVGPQEYATHGARGERREVTAGAGLAEELAPDLLAAQRRPDEALLGGLVGERHHRGRPRRRTACPSPAHEIPPIPPRGACPRSC